MSIDPQSQSVSSTNPVGWQIRDLNFAYPDSPLLFDSLSLDIGAHEIVELRGDNGKGKSTLLRLMTGELKAAQGSLTYLGKSVSTVDFGRNLYYLPQNPASALIGITGSDDLAIWRLSLKDSDKRMQLEHILRDPIYTELISQPFVKLSTGELRTMATAILPCLTDRYWILDEPFAGLDQVAVKRLLQVLKTRMDSGMPGAIIVNHNPLLTQGLKTRVIDLDEL